MNQESNHTEQILSRIQAGSDSAVDELWEIYRLRLNKMVHVRLADWLRGRVDPSDLVQETLTEASQGLVRYMETRPIAFYPWLRQIAMQRLAKAGDFHRAQKRNVMREAMQVDLSNRSALYLARNLVGLGPSPSTVAEEAEKANHIRAIVARMSAKYSELLTLRYLEELTVDECLEVLQISMTTYKKRHFRAAKQLRDLLGGRDGLQRAK